MSGKRSSKPGFGGKGGYIALAMCMVLAGVVTLATMKSTKAPQIKEPEQTQTPAVQQPQENRKPVTPVIQPEEIQDLPRPAQVIPPAEEKPEPVQSPQELVPQVVSPLDGTTVTVFSMTELMYDETMADWRTHNGVDIQAGEGDAVKTAAAGTVQMVNDDELMGTTVVIAHAGGYTTQYSSLQKSPPVAEGQEVRAGEIIGYVGSTAAAESSMGPHLHFAVSRNGEIIDPREYVG
ncbi:MAG: peptidoglycan DD-metalloendopeptidase family protein [Oscillospiraceae bacterium]|nr:peptidoglycan DD-metalloendopeptidase family protein [Oscillospiraceae bacterium]